MSRRPLRVLFVACLASAIALAQSYQSRFEAVGFDQSHHGRISDKPSVDPATGEVRMTIPLGKGIGRGNLRFVPTLRVAWAPKARTSFDREVVEPVPGQAAHWRHFANGPYLHTLGSESGLHLPGWGTLSRHGGILNLSLPDGSSVEPLGGSELLSQTPELQGETLANLLRTFGFDDYRISHFLGASADGALVLALNEPQGGITLPMYSSAPTYMSYPDSSVYDYPDHYHLTTLMFTSYDAGPGQPHQVVIPQALLVVKQGVAYLYRHAQDEYVRGIYYLRAGEFLGRELPPRFMDIPQPYNGEPDGPSIPDFPTLQSREALEFSSSGYRLEMAKNLQGERLAWTYHLEGTGSTRILKGYTATWYKDGSPDPLEVRVSRDSETEWRIQYREDGVGLGNPFQLSMHRDTRTAVQLQLIAERTPPSYDPDPGSYPIWVGENAAQDPRFVTDAYEMSVPPFLPARLTWPTGRSIVWGYQSGTDLASPLLESIAHDGQITRFTVSANPTTPSRRWARGISF